MYIVVVEGGGAATIESVYVYFFYIRELENTCSLSFFFFLVFLNG